MEYSPIISLLTDDILSNILTFLTDDSDSKSFRRVCKAFHGVDSLHRTHLRVLRPEFLPSLLTKFPNILSLDLSVCPRFDDATVAMLLSNGVSRSSSLSLLPGWTRRLKRMKLSRTPGLRCNGLEMLMRACPLLEAVDVSYCCGFGDREAAALACGVGLKDLRLDKCLGVTDVGLAKIAVGCQKLQRLSLKWCFEITDLGIDLLCKKCPELKHLDISYLKVTSNSLYSISSMQKLEVLSMVACGQVDDVGLHYLGKGCPLLQVLDISRCDKLSSSAFISVIEGHHGLLQLLASYCSFELPVILNHMKELNTLKIIIIDGARVSDSCLKVFSNSCPFLVEIGLGKCKEVTDTGIINLVSGCVNLKVLNLTCCNDLSDMAITAIADSCRNLLCLKLECCNLITERSLYHLGFNCLLLEELDLTDCAGLNDIGLKYLSKCSKLLCLKLGLCNDISDKGLSYIASNCSMISELDLYRCTGVGDDGLAALSSGCKKLKKLNLSYCCEVTDRGIACLGKLEELSDLEMRGLLKIIGPGLTALAAGCKRLAELDLKHCESIHDTGFWALAHYSRNLQQINLSNCEISDVGLFTVMGNLTRLQDVKLVNLVNVSVEGIELALRASCLRLKKLKLLASLRLRLSLEIVETLRARGCRIRWD